MRKARRRMGATSTLHLLALGITAGDIDPDCADGTAQFAAQSNQRLRKPGASNYTP